MGGPGGPSDTPIEAGSPHNLNGRLQGGLAVQLGFEDLEGLRNQPTEFIDRALPQFLPAGIHRRDKRGLVVQPPRDGGPRHANRLGHVLQIPSSDDEIAGGPLLFA